MFLHGNIKEKMWFSLAIGLMIGVAINVVSHLVINKYFINNNKKDNTA